MYIYVSVKDLAELTSEGEKPSGESNVNGSTYPGSPLQVGSRGTGVERIQFWLNALSEFDPTLPGISVDGIYGAATANAVRAFQRENGLTVDGVVGPATWNAIAAAYNSLENDIQNKPSGYPGTPLRQGDRGDSVRLMQFYLRMAASNFSSIPNITVDGVFGPATTSAVRAFQREFGLTVDGVVGSATWQKMYEVYGDVADSLLAPNQRPGTYPGTPLRQGSTGKSVREAQFYLKLLAVYFPTLPTVTIDGIYGPSTTAAVRAFQTMFGLTADGVIGPATWQALYEQSQRLRSADGLLVAFNLVPWPGFDLAVGAQGPSVAFVQFLLRYISYFYDTVQDPGKIDGIFGQTTLDSLHSWQMEFGQPETNLVDEFTWNALEATFLSLAAGVPDSTVPTAAPEYPGYVMTLGSAGGAVSQLQQAMNGIAQLYCVADFVPNDGVYGESTRDAVLAFQQGLGLPPTGVVDLNTWNKIFDLLYPPIPEA